MAVDGYRYAGRDTRDSGDKPAARAVRGNVQEGKFPSLNHQLRTRN